MTHKYKVELTDTFGGEVNYSWVKRATIELPEKHSITALVRAAKKAVGLSGVRCRKQDFGDVLEIKPIGQCIVCFVTWHEE
jgi:hypothetical protein